MNDEYVKKIEMIKYLRRYFESKGCIEVFTPIIRATCSPSMGRVKTQYGNYLRNCQESYLRLLMGYYGDVFEIGSSFRPEEQEDETHGIEFTLLEAQMQGKFLQQMMNMLREIVLEFNPDAKFEVISIYEMIKQRLGLDIKATGISAVVECLRSMYPNYLYKQDFEIINRYIHDEIEPLSGGKYVFFTEYPTCTLSIAKHPQGESEIVNRFEFFINGIEVSNSYEYIEDIDEYILRNQIVEMYTPEEKCLVERMKLKMIPTQASVIGIGVERLCMTLYGAKDISPFLHENNIF